MTNQSSLGVWVPFVFPFYILFYFSLIKEINGECVYFTIPLNQLILVYKQFIQLICVHPPTFLYHPIIAIHTQSNDITEAPAQLCTPSIQVDG